MKSIFILFFISFNLLSPSIDIARAEEKSSKLVEIIMLGDSLTAGYGLEEKYSLPSQLEKALRKDNLNISVINAGVSGDTSKGGLERLEWTLVDKVDILAIALGANDGLRGVSPDFTKDNLEKIIIQAREIQPDIKILLIGMLAPPNLGAEYSKKFNIIYSKLAEKYKIPLYPFLLDGVVTNKELNQADGIHPNNDGVKIIVEKILPFFKINIKNLTD